MDLSDTTKVKSLSLLHRTLYILYTYHIQVYTTYDLYEVHLIDITLGTCIMYQSKGTLPQKSFLILATDLDTRMAENGYVNIPFMEVCVFHLKNAF